MTHPLKGCHYSLWVMDATLGHLMFASTMFASTMLYPFLQYSNIPATWWPKRTRLASGWQQKALDTVSMYVGRIPSMQAKQWGKKKNKTKKHVI